MNGKKWPINVAIFFLVQCMTSPQISSQETGSLNPPIKVSLNKSEICFRYMFDIIYSALEIYRKDAIERRSVEELMKECDRTLTGTEPRFNVRHLGIGKKGWTRYYPFSIGEHSFIVRIFLTEESAFQPDTAVLFQAEMKNPAVTIQILPNLNEILTDCGIRPYEFQPVSQAETSP